MHWAAPHFAWLALLALPALALGPWVARYRRRDRARLAGAAGADPVGETPLMLAGVRLTAFLLLVAALCRPQWGEVTEHPVRKSLDILIALDVSASMLADDLAPSRLDVARQALAGLLPRLEGDRVGLLAFAASPYLICPLTTDYDALADLLRETGPATLPVGGSHLAQALSEARRVFQGGQEAGRVVILVSDGEDHGEGALAAARSLAAEGIHLHGVVAGTPAGGLIPRPGGDFHRDQAGRIVRSQANPSGLAGLVEVAGGRLVDLVTDPRGLESLYAERISPMQRRVSREPRRQGRERYQWPLGLALLLLLVEPWLAGRRRTWD